MRAPTQCSFSALPDGICARAVDNSVDNVDKLRFTPLFDTDYEARCKVHCEFRCGQTQRVEPFCIGSPAVCGTRPTDRKQSAKPCCRFINLRICSTVGFGSGPRGPHSVTHKAAAPQSSFGRGAAAGWCGR